MEFEVAQIDWQSNAGRLLDRFLAALPVQPCLEITIFGSAPLQLLVDGAFLSADVDLFVSEEFLPVLEQFIRDQGLGQGQTDLYIQVSHPIAFRSTIDWPLRAVQVERAGHILRFVHPWDVLVSKLQRLEEKDIDAFRLVIQKTGHPTEAEFLLHLQKAVDLYRPRFDEETQRGDMLLNTQILWNELWKRPIDPRVEIIRPSLLKTAAAHANYDPTLKAKLGAIGGNRADSI